MHSVCMSSAIEIRLSAKALLDNVQLSNVEQTNDHL
jgi:hypothetical protein